DHLHLAERRALGELARAGLRSGHVDTGFAELGDAEGGRATRRQSVLHRHDVDLGLGEAARTQVGRRAPARRGARVDLAYAAGNPAPDCYRWDRIPAREVVQDQKVTSRAVDK